MDYGDCASPLYCEAINEKKCLDKLHPRQWQILTELATSGRFTCATSKQALTIAPGEFRSIAGKQRKICADGLISR
ncbi:hypothetical protein NDU88_004041 [Pleurodeles waltl]|uniref:Uncharacterized protein n=1 Tax=Pleurodeles waltl TaxID=8319 RepID=A0AAV7KWK7_PLEWA|nr:hypothetical protein NDU88_004041 [Pleurodeles waltl]